jgi:hypothetical protein
MKAEIYILFEDSQSPTPSLVAEGDSWHLHFDNTRLLTVSNMYCSALQAWYSIFWVFSIKYPESLKYVCLFIERYCMGHKCTTPAAVKRLTDKIIK